MSDRRDAEIAPIYWIGAEPPYSVTHIDPAVCGGGVHRWHVMGTVEGDPRNPCGPVAVCEYEPSAHAISALLNANTSRRLPSVQEDQCNS